MMSRWKQLIRICLIRIPALFEVPCKLISANLIWLLNSKFGKSERNLLGVSFLNQAEVPARSVSSVNQGNLTFDIVEHRKACRTNSKVKAHDVASSGPRFYPWGRKQMDPDSSCLTIVLNSQKSASVGHTLQYTNSSIELEAFLSKWTAKEKQLKALTSKDEETCRKFMSG